MASPQHSQHEMNPFTKKPYGDRYFTLRKHASQLPVARKIVQIKDTVDENNAVVIVGETGSGKTTQVPQVLATPEGKKVALTQPRRLATERCTSRIAEEMDVGEVGGVVGMKFRGVNKTSDSTRLEVLTEGTLLAMAKSDTNLSDYGVIIIDEAHGMTTDVVIILGLLKQLAVKRKDDLKIIIMSATINKDMFLEYFPGAKLEEVEGRQHEVLVEYLPTAPENLYHTIVSAIFQVHLTECGGDILVFAPGVAEIYSIIARATRVRRNFKDKDMPPLKFWALHSRLSQEEQADVVGAAMPVSEDGKVGRNVVVSTNIAETSIALESVTHVIDSCKVKVKIWNSRDESTSLQTHPISKAEAAQRKGRAGLVRPGVCKRMCTQDGFEQFPDQPVPSIIRCDMIKECLDIKQLGFDPQDFPYIVEPATETIINAYGLLKHLDALDAKAGITERGELLAKMPVDTYAAKSLLASPDFGCSYEMICLVSIMEASEGGSNVFISPSSPEEEGAVKQARKKFEHPSGDHLTLFNIYLAWRSNCLAKRETEFVKENKLQGSIFREADRRCLQLLNILWNTKPEGWRLCSRRMDQPGYYQAILSALAAGYYLQVAKRESRKERFTYQTVRHGITVKLTKSTKLGQPSELNEFVIYNELHIKGSKKFIRLVSAIVPEYLIAAEPAYWWDAEFFPEGHIQDGLVKVLSRMTGDSEEYHRGGMPPPTMPVSAQ